MGLRHVTGLVCARCGQRQAPSASRCPECGEQGMLEPAYDLSEVARTLDRAALERREPWMWRYKELLPLDELAELPGLQVGMTPIHGAPRLAAWLGLGGLWLKDEGRSPTGSVEDRASALVVAQAREAGRRVVAVASGGPAAPSLACLAASVGLRAVVFAPEDACAGALDLAGLFGAILLSVDGPLPVARELCARSCASLKWLDATAGASAWGAEGKKTAAHEIAEQLGEKLPDWIAVPDDASLQTLLSLARGLQEMRALKIARAAPRLLRVCRGPARPAADDAAASRALELFEASRGETVSVGDEEEAQAAAQAAIRAALVVDGAGAAAVAGLKRAVEEGIVGSAETALALPGRRRHGPIAAAPRVEVGRELARVEQAARAVAVANPGQQ